MGKRSSFERVERDFYRTPFEAVKPLLPHLHSNTNFIEPCAGDGALVDHLLRAGHTCVAATDIEPQRSDIGYGDMLAIEPSPTCVIITNPPWDRKILHPFIERGIDLGMEAWLLFDADWAHTQQSASYMRYCSDIISVGRVKWIPDSKMTGKDNCAWYRFVPTTTQTVFHGRAPKALRAI